MKVTKYNTNIEEINKVLDIADDDKKIIIEDQKRIVIVCQLSKKQYKKIQKENCRKRKSLSGG